MKTVVILSGGMDSSTLLYFHAKEAVPGDVVKAISFDYGQRHRRELESAAKVCAGLGVEHLVLDIRPVAAHFGDSALLGGEPVPHGHYEDESMKKTVVPNRNMVMIAIATSVAIASGARRVSYAAHAGDHAIYPDCRPGFAEALAKAVSMCDWSEVELSRPFIDLTKTNIVTLGRLIGVPFQDTWSCYEGGEKHCGLCGTCVERKEAFVNAGVPDPTEYAA